MPGGNSGIELRSRPRSYRMTEQQHRFREALAHCEIRKGITRRELVERMVHCVPAYFAKLKGQGDVSPPAPSVEETKKHA